MAFLRIKFEGGRDLERALKKLPDGLGERFMTSALRKVFKPIRDRASDLAPIDTGMLADQILIRKLRKREVGAGDIALGVGPSKDAFYGRFQEHGVSHHGAQPFLRPAWDEGRGRMLQQLKVELWKRINRRRR